MLHRDILQPHYQLVAQNGECLLVLFAYRFLGLRLYCQRVDGLAVLVNAEIKVRSCGKSCGTNISYYLFLLYHITHFQSLGKFREVHVCSCICAVVANLYLVSATFCFVTLVNDLAVSNGIYRCSHRSSIIHAMVCPTSFQYRVHSAAREF